MTERIHVVKLGSELAQKEQLYAYARGLSETYDNTVQTIVTSGAVAAGAAYEEAMGHDVTDYKDVTLAQIGGAIINGWWSDAYRELGITTGGLFVTDRELDDLQEGARLRETLLEARRHGIVTTVNENDPLSNRGLMANKYGGDNDGIASHLAQFIGADALTLFTKKGGIFDSNNRLIELITDQNRDEIRAMLVEKAVSNKARGKGRGGIVTKFDSAWAAAKGGVKDVRVTAVSIDMAGVNTTRFVVG
jgi:glutamate 5-kinase